MTNTVNKLDRATERKLIFDYQQTGNEQCLEQLLEAHDGYIRKIASRQYQLLKRVVEFDDLVQTGRLGLITAIKKFNLNRISVNPKTNKVVTNQALLTYAHAYILSEIQSLSHHSYSTHIPAHTLRAINFNIKKPGSNTEERKALARKAMQAESLNWNNDNKDHYEHRTLLTEEDPTFNQSLVNIFSPENQKAIEQLSKKEWMIIKMRFGLDEGIIAKSNFIADKLGISIEDVEKTFKRAKRSLSKNLIKPKENVLCQ